MWNLRFTLRAYRRPRAIVSAEGVAGEQIWPANSVAPGSPTAIYEVAALLCSKLERFEAQWEPVGFRASVQVDDVCIAGSF